MISKRFLLHACVVALLSACSGGDSTAPKVVPVASVAISMSASTVKAGKTVQFSAQAKDVAGNILSGRSFNWTSSQTSIASIAADGTLTAITAGATVVSATSEGKVADFALTVSRASIAVIVLAISPSQLAPGQSVQAVAALTDSTGKAVTDAVLNWSSTDQLVARVDANGLVTAAGAGTTRIDARAEGILGSMAVSVAIAPVATVVITLAPSTLLVGQTGQASAVVRDAQGSVLSGRPITWSSSDTSVASVSAAGVLTARKAGASTISALSEGKSGSAQLTVAAAQSTCTGSQLLTLALGEIRTLTSAQKSFFCLTGATASEFVVIPFNNSAIAASTIGLELKGTNTSVPATISADLRSGTLDVVSFQAMKVAGRTGELAFRRREYNDLKSAIASLRGPVPRYSKELTPSRITGIPSTPAIGAVFPVNVNLLGNTCTSPKILRGARVVTVTPRVIVLVDTLAPAGGYTSSEMAAFGQSFETGGYPVDTLNFGAPTDIDGNGRVAVLFTTGVNLIPQPPGSVILGLQTGRDLFPVSTCPGSNEGEIFYMPVVDPNRTINGNYPSKASLSNSVLATLAHELQHLINLGRRIYVNNASVAEEVWLNEGLSHVAEELLYYQVSGNAPRSNINLARVQSTQAQLNAFNQYQFGNFSLLARYMEAPEINSPYAQNDDLESRGAIWQLLRYAADKRGGSEPTIWRSLVNTTSAGQSNFNAVFGDIVSQSRDWAVAQFADDIGFSIVATYTNQSWNFRSLSPALNGGVFPLATRPLGTTPLNGSIVGGAAAYVRFQIGGTSPATLTMTSSGQPLPSGIDVIVMRTK